MTHPLELSAAAYSYLLAFADDEHMVGSRHANWIGLGPFLEEDLAFCSIAQDELGHALALYEMLIPANEIDRFALLRPPADYRSCALAELECGTWALALVRHWIYDLAEGLRWEALAQSSVEGLAELAVQAEREESFHRSHAQMYMERIVQDHEGRRRVDAALAEVAPHIGTVFAPPELENDALEEGVASESSVDLARRWFIEFESQATEFGLTVPTLSLEASTDVRCTRSPGFADFHASLGEVISLDVEANW